MKSTDILETEFLDCVCPLVNVRWFLDAGGFDEAMPGWGSDIDLCYRTRGDRKLIIGTERIHHPYETTSKRLSDSTMYKLAPTRAHLLAKHGSAIKQFCPLYFGGK
jgi:GT2 family glycosyltransferase